MKKNRQSIILDIIENENIETQSQLIDALTKRGIKSTQATLSRDINDLELVKDGGHYIKSVKSIAKENSDRLRKIFHESIISTARAQNIIVLKTLPGLANAACSALDHISIDGLVGTLAGDDTAFLAMKDNDTAELLLDSIKDSI